MSIGPGLPTLNVNSTTASPASAPPNPWVCGAKSDMGARKREGRRPCQPSRRGPSRGSVAALLARPRARRVTKDAPPHRAPFTRRPHAPGDLGDIVPPSSTVVTARVTAVPPSSTVVTAQVTAVPPSSTVMTALVTAVPPSSRAGNPSSRAEIHPEQGRESIEQGQESIEQGRDPSGRARNPSSRARNPSNRAGNPSSSVVPARLTAFDPPDHRRAGPDHGRSSIEHRRDRAGDGRSAIGHRRAGPDHGRSSIEHRRAGPDHGRSSGAHGLAGTDPGRCLRLAAVVFGSDHATLSSARITALAGLPDHGLAAPGSRMPSVAWSGTTVVPRAVRAARCLPGLAHQRPAPHPQARATWKVRATPIGWVLATQSA